MKAQGLIIGHLLPIMVTVVVLWLVYRLLFRNSNRLRFNRYFLLTSMLLALAMPLLGLFSGRLVPEMANLKQNLFQGFILNEIIVTPDGQPVLPEVTMSATPSRFSIWQVIGALYLLGVCVMTLWFLIKLARLSMLIIRSPKRKMDGFTAVFLSVSDSSVPEDSRRSEAPQQGSFSFFRYAIFPNENVDPNIMRHELSHIEHCHSWDIIFSELMIILQWFNPFIYLYKKELQSIHEYQADRDVVATGVDKKNYMMLILQQCTAVDFSGMSNNFSLILTKKRIKMITRNEKAKRLWWRLLATLPVLALLLFANTKVVAQKTTSQIVNPNEFNELVNAHGVTIPNVTEGEPTIVINPDGSYTKVTRETVINPDTKDSETNVTFEVFDKDGNPQPQAFSIMPVERNGEKIIKIVPNEGTYFIEPKGPDNDTIYEMVDVMPGYPGGLDSLMVFIGRNVKYPEEAMEKGISGKVFVQFVVEKNGSVNDVKVLKGVCEILDDEATRVVKAMPKWTPGQKDGKTVRVAFTLPINFKLQD